MERNVVQYTHTSSLNLKQRKKQTKCCDGNWIRLLALSVTPREEEKKGVREISVCLTLFGSASHLCTPSKKYVNNQGLPPLFSCYLSGKGVESHNSSSCRGILSENAASRNWKRKRHIHFSHCNGFFNVGADRPLERSVTWTQKPLDHASWDFRRRRLLPDWLLAGVASERKPFQFPFASFDTKFIKTKS